MSHASKISVSMASSAKKVDQNAVDPNNWWVTTFIEELDEISTIEKSAVC